MDTSPSIVPLGAPEATLPGTRYVPMRFSGSAGEYFRLWIVNVALTILTLGIYGAWAKVRTRRYFYGHTWLERHNFEYTASPVAILMGHLIVGLLFAVYLITSNFGANPDTGISLIGVSLLLLFFLLTPWLIYKSLRFTARNTIYRGLRFHFHGSVAEAYGKYLGWPLLVPFTLGLLHPYVVALQRQFMAENAAYGSARVRFEGRTGDVYIIFLIGVALGIGAYTVFGVLFAASLVPLFAAGLTDASDLLAKLGSSIGFAILAVLAYLILILGLTAVTQFIKASLMNYTLNNAEIPGRIRFQSKVNPWRLTWIQVTNTLAQFLTLGLATPWAAVRRARYILGCIAVLATGQLDDFTAEASVGENALGEVATDFFDIDLGF
ncbi:YjgN family protein [Deinococcus peraridilitoris]|uniref:Putative membrane protein n=1 Tax=Deinococcus peraridilitoris (strain DSM 19664 / LMG 22246 / CIP 109416 / KR-200) TaxID=937777 RepID=L0A470_DEIPD|nr:YjgN family protein [Deinococcus peraridilitoris]AFZ68631.1 putative membrane protein [Deinococcus peraridilitoris DSM 19664]